MEVLCIRHGQTVANLDGIHGLPDTLLTPKGKKQAEDLAAGMERDGTVVDVVVSSPLIRAVQTARVIAERLQVPHEVMPNLAPRDLGSLAGSDNPTFNRWMEHSDYGTRPGGGESLLDGEHRMKKDLAVIQEKYGGSRVLIVVHNAVLRIFDHLFGGLTEAEVMRKNYRPCALYRYELRKVEP